MYHKMHIWILLFCSLNYCEGFEGFGTPAINVENDVGVLRLFQPSFVGRNVTFEFTPSISNALGDVRWKYEKINNSFVANIDLNDEEFLVHDDGKSSFFVLPDVDLSLNETTVYTSIGNNTLSSKIKLVLKDYTNATGCGELYLLSVKPYVAGDNVSFAYFPSPMVAKDKNPSRFNAKLINVKNKGALELHQEGNEFLATFFNVKKTDSGNFRIQCSDGPPGIYSNDVHLSIKDKPRIGPLTTISMCRECIVFKAEDSLKKVYCETDEGYNVRNVTFEIGQTRYTSTERSLTEFGLTASETPTKELHLHNCICSVFGIYRNMSVEATLFVPVSPSGPPQLSASKVLLEGKAVDITCTSAKARPPALLKLFVGKDAIDTNLSIAQIDEINGLYRSVLKLDSFKREWRNKNMWCQQLPEVEGLYYPMKSNTVNIQYRYPPSRLIITFIGEAKLTREKTVSCIARYSYPMCNIKWESSIEDFKYTNLQESGISTISFNVSDDDFGKQIRCIADCPDFPNALSNSTIVIFAKKPKVVIQISSVLPVPLNTNLTVTCYANAYPDGNIIWNVMKASNSLSSHVTCLNASTCTYEMTTSDADQEYLCIAKNEHGTDRVSMIVTVQEPNENEELTGTGTLGVKLGIPAGFAFLLIVIVVIQCRRRRRRQKQAKLQSKIENNSIEIAPLQSRTAADNDEVTHVHMDGAEYAEIHKTRRDPENVALITVDEDMLACEAKNECLDNAATRSSVHVEQQLIDFDDSAQDQTQSTQHDARTAADADAIDVTHARMDGAEYAVIDKTHRDPKLVALPSSKDISSCKANNERLDNSATESSVNVEQPSLEKGKLALESGSLTQPNVSGCHSKEDINTTEKVKDIVVSKQKQITNPDAPNANIPKRATDELVYADVDIEYLEKSRSGNRACNNDEPTEYSDIVFGASCSV